MSGGNDARFTEIYDSSTEYLNEADFHRALAASVQKEKVKSADKLQRVIGPYE